MLKMKNTMRNMLALFIFCAAFTGIMSFSPPAKHAKVRTIIVDAGHGGVDPGTHGLISKEKEVTLEISLKLGEAIKKEFPDVKVVYTRTTDILPGNATNIKDGLQNRAAIANQSKGDLFVSIHCNATPQPPGGWYAKRVIGHKMKLEYVGRGKRKRKKMVNAPIYESYWVKNMRTGTETYIWKADRSGKKSEAITEADESGEDVSDSTVAAFDLSSPEARMRAQLYEKKYFDNSYLLASMVEDEFAKFGRTSYGVKQRDVGIRVLQATGMPSILVETGFLTNKEEEEYLNSDKGQDEIVDNIIQAIHRYTDQLEGHPTDSGKTAPAGNNN
jgi:N-acetylmuramoyl-L-alanine amidase